MYWTLAKPTMSGNYLKGFGKVYGCYSTNSHDSCQPKKTVIWKIITKVHIRVHTRYYAKVLARYKVTLEPYLSSASCPVVPGLFCLQSQTSTILWVSVAYIHSPPLTILIGIFSQASDMQYDTLSWCWTATANPQLRVSLVITRVNHLIPIVKWFCPTGDKCVLSMFKVDEGNLWCSFGRLGVLNAFWLRILSTYDGLIVSWGASVHLSMFLEVASTTCPAEISARLHQTFYLPSRDPVLFLKSKIKNFSSARTLQCQFFTIRNLSQVQ